MSKLKAEESSPIAIKPTMQVKEENVDDTDLYSDVLSSQDAGFEKLLQEVEKLRKEKTLLLKSLNSLQTSYEKLQKEIEGLENRNKTLAYNASTLFKTAQAEINRKDKTIQVLRKEKDDILFRRSSSMRALRRSRRSETASPRKMRTPLKSKISSDYHSRPTTEDSARINSKQGNAIDVERDPKEKTQVVPEGEIEVNHGEEKDKNMVLSDQHKEEEEEEEEEGGEEEEELQAGPYITYVPPPIQGPITMYSKRLYKKLHGVSPQKVSPATTESLKSTVRDLPKDSTTSSLLMVDKKHPSTQNTVQAHETSGQVKLSPRDSSKSNINNAVSKDFKNGEASITKVTHPNLSTVPADQTFVQPNDCNNTSFTSKLKSNTQEFIKLGSSLKSCKSSPSLEVIVDLRKLPKENYGLSDSLVKEILNSPTLKSGISKAHTNSTSSTTKKTEVVDMSKNEVIGPNTPSTKRTNLAKNEDPEVEMSASSTEMIRSVVVLHTAHDSHKSNNRDRARGNTNANKPVIAPVTFGRLVPHDPLTVVAKTSVRQSGPLKDQSVEPQKRKCTAESPAESISPATLENPSLNILERVKKRKIIDELFGESPIKSDRPDENIVDQKSPSPTLIFPESPSLDSDNSEDLVIDTTACSVKSPSRLSEWEQNDGIERVKANSPSKDTFEVGSITKTSSKPIENNLIHPKDKDRKSNKIDNQSFFPQALKNFKEIPQNHTLPDLADCFSLDNDIHKVGKAGFIGGSENIKDINPSQKFTAFVQPESKPHNHSVNDTKKDISIFPRFVPSPPQQSGLTLSENSLLNIAVDTMDFISTLALTKVGSISPLRTPDKRHNALVTKKESPKLDLCSDHIDRESTAPSVIALENISHIIQDKDSNKETGDSNNVIPNDSPKHFTDDVNTDCLLEKHNLSDRLISDKKPQYGDSRKYTQPHNEFKRKRPVRRVCSTPTIKDNIITLNSNKENVKLQPVSSNSLTSGSINCSEVDLSTQGQVSSPDKCESLAPQSMDANAKNEKIISPNSKYISKDEEPPLCFPPILESQIDKKEHMKPHVVLNKKPLNPHLPKETQHSKAEEYKLLPDVMVVNNTSKLDAMSDVVLNQNEQHATKLLNADVNKSTSQLENPRIVSVPNEQEHLIQANCTKLPDKQSYPLNFKEINVAADMSKSTSTAMPSKVKTQKDNELPEYLVKLINSNPDVNAMSKLAKASNANIKEINSKNKVKTTCEPIDLSVANNQKTLRSSSRESVLHKDKQAGKKLPVRKATIYTDMMPFKRSVSIKMAKPMPKVKFYDQVKKRSTDDGSSEKKHAFNTDEELKEMPHVARINQKVRVSTYQGRKSQHIKGLEEISPIMNKKERPLKQKAELKLPESALKCEIDENVVAIKRSVKIGSGDRTKISRRSVSIERVPSKTKRQSLTEKQLRSKSNERGTFNLNKTIPEISVKKDEIKITNPLKRIEFQRHSRRSESESPDRERISKHNSSEASDRTSISRDYSQSENKSHDQERITNKNFSSHESSRSSRVSAERTPTGSKLNVLNSSGEFCAAKSKKNSRLSVSPKRVTIQSVSQSPTDQQSGSGNKSHFNHDSIEPQPDNSVKRARSKSPSPVKKVKFEQDCRRSQSLSPDRRLSSKHNNDKIQTTRSSSSSRKNSRYHENQNTTRSSRSISSSPERTLESKRYHRHRSRESESPEPKIRSRTYHESRRVHRRSPTEEYRSRSRKRSRTPPHRSNSHHYRKKSPCSEARHHRYVNPRNRSRNQYEKFRSRSPPRYYKRSRSCHSPDQREIFQSSGSHRTHKRQFPQEEKYNASETGTEAANVHATYMKEISELRKELAEIKGTVSKNKDQNQEKERGNILRPPNNSPEKRKVDEINHQGGLHSRSLSLNDSQQAKQSSQTSNPPELVQTSSLLKEKNDHSYISPISDTHSRNERVEINSQQLVNGKNTSLTNQKESVIISNNTVSTTCKPETTPHIPVRRIRRRTRNLGDSEMRVVSATVNKD